MRVTAHQHGFGLGELGRRFMRDFGESFRPQAGRFDPNDPRRFDRVVVALLLVMAAALAASVAGQAVLHLWRMLGSP